MKFFYIALISLLSTSIWAQRQEVGLFGGTASYSGDLSDSYISTLVETKFAFGAFYRYNHGQFFSVKGSVTGGALSGSDINAQSLTLKKRNLNFKTTIVELAILPEFNIYNFYIKKSGHVITPYLSTGISFFYFNPTTVYQEQVVNLQPLGTEGQGLPGYPAKYNRTSFGIPIISGWKFAFNKLGTIGVEFGLRKTFTDYIDDASTTYPDLVQLGEVNGLIAQALSDRTPEYTGIPSLRQQGDQRASPSTNDWYFFSGLSVSFIINPEKKELPPSK